MSRKKLLSNLSILSIAAATFLFVGNTPALAQQGSERSQFVRNLRLGDRGLDVKALQIILNSDTETRIAPSGSGSPGQETDYFGQLTLQAVIRFQNLHKKDIFAKAGISGATGFVGTATRSVLEEKNTAVSAIGAAPVTPPSTAPAATRTSQTNSVFSPLSLAGAPRITAAVKQKVFLYRALPAQVAPKGTVTLSGSGFDATENTVHFAGTAIPNLPSADGKTINVPLPGDLALQKHEVWVENKNGTTKGSPSPIRFLVTNTPVDPPKIIAVNPSLVSIHEDTIVITGTGFAPAGNNFYTSLGTAMNLSSSDGKTISLKLNSLSNLEKVKNPDLRGITISLWMSIQNENGTQIDPFPVPVTL